jgi:hypothetical protein
VLTASFGLRFDFFQVRLLQKVKDPVFFRVFLLLGFPHFQVGQVPDLREIPIFHIKNYRINVLLFALRKSEVDSYGTSRVVYNILGKSWVSDVFRLAL